MTYAPGGDSVPSLPHGLLTFSRLRYPLTAKTRWNFCLPSVVRWRLGDRQNAATWYYACCFLLGAGETDVSSHKFAVTFLTVLRISAHDLLSCP